MEEQQKSKKNIIILTLVGIFFSYLTYSSYKNWKMTEEDRIRQVLYSVRDGLAKGNSEPILNAITEDFRDHLGNNRDRVRVVLLALFYQEKRTYHIQFQQIEVKLDSAKKKAQVFFTASRDSNQLRPNRKPEIQANLKFIKQEDSWKIQVADYHGVDEW